MSDYRWLISEEIFAKIPKRVLEYVQRGPTSLTMGRQIIDAYASSHNMVDQFIEAAEVMKKAKNDIA